MINFGFTPYKDFGHMLDKVPTDTWIWEGRYVHRYTYKLVTPYKETDIGYLYRVIMFRKNLTNFRASDLLFPECFTCCLIEPPYYISALVQNGYSGLVTKEFDNSGLFEKIFDGYKTSHKRKSWHDFYMEKFDEYYAK